MSLFNAMDELRNLKRFSGKVVEYPRWKMDFTCAMKLKDIDAAMTTAQSPQGIDAATWLGKQRKLYACLMLALDDRTAALVDADQTVADNGYAAWQLVKKIYEGSSTLRL